MELTKIHWIGITSGMTIMLISLFLAGTVWLFFLMGIGIITLTLPFIFSTVRETQVENEKEEMFLEFARNLSESGKTGIPISRSIINSKSKPYGVLSKHIEKLANQIYLGIPLGTALQVFSRDVNNKTVSRAITLIGQAEKSGGDIGEILESVSGAVSTADKLKKERRAVISTLIVQGYIIFFVFMIIILILQFKIIPMISGIGELGSLTSSSNVISGTGGNINQLEISSAFFYLLLIQGFFSGLAVGKLAERNFKAGIKHSFILMLMAFMISAIANFFF